MSQTRRRKRTPAVPEQKVRVYCPSCFEVQSGYGYWRALYGSTVHPHYRQTAAARQSEAGDLGEPVTSVLCKGGDVDLVKDRAP